MSAFNGGRARAALSNEARWSSTQDHWCTPEVVLAPVRQLAGGRIALDPCSNSQSIVNARVAWTGPDAGGVDGLAMPWPRRGLVFVNPPYSAKAIWMRKCAGEARRGVEIVALLPADTDVQWFQEDAVAADRRCFLRGRLKFLGDRSSTARFPSVILYWGQRIRRCDGVFGPYGWLA
jgi:phage N-6-adenine-methyltransferase